jgi:hypothetical protein
VTARIPLPRIGLPGYHSLEFKENVGGHGSGRWHDHEKATAVEDCLFLDTALLCRDRLLQRRSAEGRFDWRDSSDRIVQSANFILEHDATPNGPRLLVFFVAAEGPSALVRGQIFLKASRPQFGGQRWWFICPRCSGLARKLFMPLGKAWFGCRRCHKLTYRSCQESHTMLGCFHRLRRLGLLPAV